MKAVILAGGKGRRLSLYDCTPQAAHALRRHAHPRVVRRQLTTRVRCIMMAVGYLPELLMAFCGDGASVGCRPLFPGRAAAGHRRSMALIAGLDQPFSS